MRRILVWVAIATGIGVLVGTSTLASSFRNCAAEHQEEYANSKQPDFYEKFGTFVVCEGVTIDDNGDLFTAIGTIAIAIFTFTLWSFPGRAVALGRAEFNATNRPDIVIHSVRVVRGVHLIPSGPEGPVGAEVTYQ